MHHPIDKLFLIFLTCGTVGDLVKCFNNLFQAISHKTLARLFIPEEYDSELTRTINHIYERVFDTPPITAKKALEYMIDLGIGKLKRDYFSVMSHFNPIEFNTNESQYWVNSKVNLPISKLSINPIENGICLGDVNKKCSKLIGLHLVSEFLFLVRENLPSLSSNVFSTVMQSVESKFLNNSYIEESLNIDAQRLYEVEVNLITQCPKIIER